jgi:hypothetical protein
MLDYIQARAQRANECVSDFQSLVPQMCRQNALFSIEYRFDFRSEMRAILPISCSLLRSWTVLPSGL